MSGSIVFRKDRRRWVVSWSWQGNVYKISRYNGRLMHGNGIRNKRKDDGYRRAEKLLAQMQGDVENKCFRIEKYLETGWTDVIPYFESWLETKKKKTPATYKGYKSYFKNWIRPFFESHPVQLHEIQLDTLDKLLESLRLSGKGKHNVMMCFHAFLDYAWRAKRIPEIPPFPKRSDYKIVAPSIKWLPSDRQVKVIEAIPEIHQPIFWFLKYHYRRPGEACALHKCDYDIINKVFIIRRSVSARQVVNHTKTDHEHVIPCHRNMVDLIDHLARQPGQFMFENPRARKDGKRYTLESLNVLWRQACKDTGENIDMYSGLKHSSCSQFVNEMGGSLSDLQVLTDHARMDSVRPYAETQIARKRELMDSSGKDLAGLLKVVK